ncbi:MAG: thiosulfate oxidation carrier complex protein SoxZ [Betaproteobacteria bacterium]|nr:thiosulfate oxidation carrier complex protein SoxZ [Betaproteobacteria bacterium]
MARALITVPPNAKRGEVIEVRVLIQHPMETGYRPGSDGRILPRDLIRKFSCRYDDGKSNEIVFSAELYAAIAANPLISFHTVATGSGTLTFLWEGDNGFMQSEMAAIKVS